MSQNKSSYSLSKKKPKRKNGEGSVYWDERRGKYAASIHDINGKRQRAYFDTEDKAHEWRSAQLGARKKGEGTFVRDPNATLEDYLNEWLLARKGLAPNSIRYYSQTIKHRINPHIGNVKLKNMTPRIIEDFLFSLIDEKGYKGGTVRGVIRTLNKAFNDGVRWGDLPHNLMIRVVTPKTESTPSPRIPAKDVERLRAQALANPFDAARLEIGVAIGRRPGEVAGLKWKDFDAQSMTLSVVRQIQRYKGLGLVEEKTKTNNHQTVPLITHEVALLESLFRYQTMLGKERGRIISQEDYIFTNSVGKPMDPTFDRKWFKKLCQNAGIPNYQKIQMRKTAFTDLSHVAGLEVVKQYSGHTQISTLMNHYIDPEQVVVRAALQRRYENKKGLENFG